KVRRWRRVFKFSALPKFSNAKSDDFRSVRDTSRRRVSQKSFWATFYKKSQEKRKKEKNEICESIYVVVGGAGGADGGLLHLA
ncbi:MAG: hypothetical protein IIX81_00135, partial [Tidjanibacter sp.]|nr:hypothetical protein [Tidjanibacter sp.]